MDSFADRLKAARESAELTQAQLAAKYKIGQSAIGNMEAGGRGGSRHIARLANALGVNAYWLETGEGSPTGLSKEAAEIAKMFDRLSEAKQRELAPIIRLAIGSAVPDSEVEEKMPATKTARSSRK